MEKQKQHLSCSSSHTFQHCIYVRVIFQSMHIKNYHVDRKDLCSKLYVIVPITVSWCFEGLIHPPSAEGSKKELEFLNEWRLASDPLCMRASMRVWLLCEWSWVYVRDGIFNVTLWSTRNGSSLDSSGPLFSALRFPSGFNRLKTSQLHPRCLSCLWLV